ncbi:MAG: M24 family metallopeptidase, partial [Bacillota bacterium]
FLLKEARPELQFLDASVAIARMRAIKDRHETRIMKEAGAITDRVFAAVLRRLRVGMTEYDIAREVDHQVIVCGGSGVSFHTGIVVSGDGIPRMPAKDRKTGDTPVVPGASITFDFGVLWQGYASDFGRTVFCGEPKKEYREYHDLVMEAQAAAVAAMKAGQITARELNRVARRVIEEAGLGDYFTHRLGHGIGIDVHEPPFLYELDGTVLQEGMCFTVEPSIRIPDGVAVRVEDVVQVTREGGVPFTSFSRDYLVI